MRRNIKDRVAEFFDIVLYAVLHVNGKKISGKSPMKKI